MFVRIQEKLLGKHQLSQVFSFDHLETAQSCI